MFNTYDFTFAGTPASLYRMLVCDIGNKSHSDNEFGNKANIVETRIANRITPLHYGVRYHDEPLRFKLIFASEQYLDRYEIQEISNWLTGYQEYQWLSIDQPDMEHIQFHCLIESLTPVSVRWFPIAFEASVVCDCPYGYSYPFKDEISVDGSTAYRLYNDSTVRERIHPELKIELSQGCGDFTIINQTTGSVIQFSGLPSEGITILMDNENEILQDAEGQYDLYDHFNYQFFELASGDNNLIFNGTGKVTISGRYLYNVGA